MLDTKRIETKHKYQIKAKTDYDSEYHFYDHEAESDMAIMRRIERILKPGDHVIIYNEKGEEIAKYRR